MKILAIVLPAVILSLCSKPSAVNSELNLTKGYLLNFTGLDGCGWVLKTEENGVIGTETFEPVNINEFKLDKQDSMKVEFAFSPFDGASICMVGKQVKLISIRERR
jgi:hypothetical protein